MQSGPHRDPNITSIVNYNGSRLAQLKYITRGGGGSSRNGDHLSNTCITLVNIVYSPRGDGCSMEKKIQRRPLAAGNVYHFPGYPSNGFTVTSMSLPGTGSDDGGLPGVGVKWLNRSGGRFWYPFSSEAEFWKDIRFSNACDPESSGGCEAKRRE